MATYTDFYLHTGGIISYDGGNFQYDISGPNAKTKRLRLKNKPTFRELVHKIHVKLGLGLNDEVSRIIYKVPMFNQVGLYWTSVDLEDDDDIEIIYENLRKYDSYTLVELIIEVNKADVGANMATYAPGNEDTNEELDAENIIGNQQIYIHDVGPSQPMHSVSRHDIEMLSQSNFVGEQYAVAGVNVDQSGERRSISNRGNASPGHQRQLQSRRDVSLLGAEASDRAGHIPIHPAVSQLPAQSVRQPRRSFSRRVGNFFSKSLFGNRSERRSNEMNLEAVSRAATNPNVECSRQRHSVSQVPDLSQRHSISQTTEVHQQNSGGGFADVTRRRSVSHVAVPPPDIVNQSDSRRDGDLLGDSISEDDPSFNIGGMADEDGGALSNEYMSSNEDVDAEDESISSESDESEFGGVDECSYSHDASPLASIHPCEGMADANFSFPSEHYTQIDFDAAQVNLSEGIHFQTWDGVSELSTGLVFNSKEEVQSCVKKFSIKRNVDFRVVESKPTFWVLRCPKSEDGCKWRLRAARKGNCPLWKITRYGDPHSCLSSNLTKDHRQLGSKVIRNCIMGMVSKNPTLPVDVIIAAIKQQFNFEVSYKKAWYAKIGAIEAVFGNYVESYETLPGFLHALQNYNAGTVYELKTRETNLPNVRQFQRVFWSFKPAIDGFLHCKPILLIDGTFLTGKFQQTMLIASSVDGNSMLFPLAFAIVESENKSSWAWFMSLIRKHVTQSVGITVISDRHAGIMAVFRDERSGWKEPLSFHRLCLRHFVSNYNTHHRNKTIKDLLYKAGTQYQKRIFTKHMDKIKEMDEESYNWAMRVPLDRWTFSEDGGYRYGHATTNIAESVNSALKGVRMMPITAIVEHVFGRLVKFYDQRRQMYISKMTEGLRFTPKCVQVMSKNSIKARGHMVVQYDNRYGLFSVIAYSAPEENTEVDTYVLSLDKRECECGQFQGMKIPCSHAIAACMHRHIDPYTFVDKCYTITEALKCYDGEFRPMAHKAYWPQYYGPKLAPDMELMRKKGRPKTNRIRNEMDRRDRSNVGHCSKCGNVGHNKKTCTSGAGPSNQSFRS